MTDFQVPTSQDLATRRQRLRQQRRYRLLQGIWRAIAISGLTAGTVWVATSPVWLIQSGEQLDISGNQLLSDDEIQALLPIDYPQPLLKVQPQTLSAQLKKHGPIADAIVSRRLFPPGLHVRVQERYPVAVALPDPTEPISAIPAKTVPFQEMGLLDQGGFWMPYDSFSQSNHGFELPGLQVYGMRPTYQEQWAQLYPMLSRSPVKISEVDWRNPNNLILQTELGEVHLGPFGPRFSEQLVALDQMRSLNGKVGKEKIAYIDLREPQSPAVEISKPNKGS